MGEAGKAGGAGVRGGEAPDDPAQLSGVRWREAAALAGATEAKLCAASGGQKLLTPHPMETRRLAPQLGCLLPFPPPPASLLHLPDHRFPTLRSPITGGREGGGGGGGEEECPTSGPLCPELLRKKTFDEGRLNATDLALWHKPNLGARAAEVKRGMNSRRVHACALAAEQ